jgi:hypothetical protein
MCQITGILGIRRDAKNMDTCNEISYFLKAKIKEALRVNVCVFRRPSEKLFTVRKTYVCDIQCDTDCGYQSSEYVQEKGQQKRLCELELK